MPDLLPDIPSDVFNNWSAGQFAQAAGDKIASIGGDISQGVQSALAPPPPAVDDSAPPPEPPVAPPPPPEPAPPPPPVAPAAPPPDQTTDQAPPPDVPPPPSPDQAAPAPTDISPPPDQTAAPPPSPTPAPPTPTPTAPPPATQAPSSPGGIDFGAALNAASAAGADVGQFAQSLNDNLSSAGNDAVGAVLNAASAAGADMGQFSQAIGPAITAPVQQAASTAGQAAQSLGITGPTPNAPGDLIDQARQAATAAGIDPDIFARQINQESGFNPTAKSGAGALGIAQFMPATAAGMKIDPMNATQALTAAAQLDAQNLQKYGGDWGEALAAYNAGGGNVDKYGGIPPFAETQSYVKNILGGAQNVVQQVGNAVGGAAQDAAQTGLTAVNTAQDAAQSAAARTSQFGMGLSSGDAMAFCGPAAAMAFAETFGRNPTVDEAKQLAQQVGWNPDQGMAGPSSEVSLLNKLGIDTHMSQGVDWSQVATEASSGNPVIIDTPGHYFYVQGYNSQTGQYNLGTSATDLKAAQGQQWFTPDQISSLGMGDPRAAIYADHPLSDASSVATNSPQSNSISSLLSNGSQAASAVGQKAQDTMSAVLNAGSTDAQDLASNASNWLDSQKSKLSDTLQNAGSGAQDLLSQTGQSAQDLVSAAQQQGQDLTSFIQQAPDAAAQVVQQAADTASQPSDPLSQVAAMGPQAQTLLNQVGGGTQDLLSQMQALGPNALSLLSQASQGIGTAATGAAQTAQNVVNQLPVPGTDEYQRLQDYAAQHPGQVPDALNPNVNTPLDLSKPISQQVGSLDPLTAIQAGVPQIIQGAQTGNYGLGGVLGGVLQVAGAVLGSNPGAGGELASGGLKLADLLSSPELAYASTRQAGESAADYIARMAANEPHAGNAAAAAYTAATQANIAPATGTGLLQGALDRLSQYPEEVADPIRNFASATDAPASEVATTIQRWMLDNPIESVPDPITGPTQLARNAGQQAVADIADAVNSGRTSAFPPGSIPDLLAQSSTQGASQPLADLLDTLLGGQQRNLGVRSTAGYLPPGVMSGQEALPLAEGTDLFNQIGQTADPTQNAWLQQALSRSAAQPGLPTGGGLLEDLQAGERGSPYQPQQTLGTYQQAFARAAQGGQGDLFNQLAQDLSPGGLTRTPSTPLARPDGNAVSGFGQRLASALSPTENLPAAVRAPIERFANVVGRNSDAATVMAQSEALRNPALTDDAVQAYRSAQRSQASAQLVSDLRQQKLAYPRQSAPSGFRTVTDVPGDPLSRYAFHPDVAGPIRAVVDRSGVANTQLGRNLLNVGGTAKETLFSLSNFHTVTEGLNAAFSSPQTLKNYARAFFSDSFAQGTRGAMADTFDQASRAGVTGLATRGASSPDATGAIGNALWRRVTSGAVGGVGGGSAGYVEAKASGKSDADAWRQALAYGGAGAALAGLPLGGRGTASEILQSALWDRAVPLAKATAWDGLRNSGMDPNAAAKVVNERFGGLNYAAMGRSPTFQDATKLLVQAPDWSESTVRQLGSALFGGSGQGVRAGFLAKTIGGMMTATEIANYAFSGHSTLQNQPGHQGEIEIRDPAGGFTHIGILPGNIQTAVNELDKLGSDTSAKRGSDITNFLTARASEPVRLLAEAGQTAASGGKSLNTPYAVSKGGTLAGLASTASPISVSQVAQGTNTGGVSPLLASLMAIAGLNPTYTSAANVRNTGAAPSGGRGTAPLPAVAPARAPRPAVAPRPAPRT